MENATAGELMIPIEEYPKVSDSATLMEAIEEMDNKLIKKAGITALPRVVLVFHNKAELVGVVRRRDIFRGLEPEFLSPGSTKHMRNLFDVHVDPNLSEFSPNHTFKAAKKNVNRQVKEVMIPIIKTIDANDHIMKIISTMVEFNISMIPVTKGNEIVGVVRSVDALHYISHEVLRKV